MIKKLLFTLSLCMFVGSVLYAQSTIKGKIEDADGNPLSFSQVILLQDGKVVNGAYTDDNGAYQIFGISAGTYDITAGGTMSCLTKHTEKGIYVSSMETKFVNLKINCSNELSEVEVVYVPPVFSQDNTKSSQVLTGDEVRKTPGRSITAALANMEGVATVDGDMKSVRGNRSDGQQMIIDGVRVRGNGGITMQSVEGAELIQGGIPAEYGDGTSFQVITTRGVSKDYHGGVELRASLEGYGQFLAAASVSGPILKGKTQYDPARIGFLISAEGTYNIDDRPLRGGSWVAKPEAIDNIIARPVEYNWNINRYVPQYRAEALTGENFKKAKVRPNAQDFGFIAQAKIDFMGGGKDARGKSKNNLRFSIGGSYQYINEHLYDVRNSLFNSANNSVRTNSTLRLNARLNHRVKTDTAANAILKNIMYDININYTLFNGKTQDQNHKDNLFGYGYVGKFNTTRETLYEYQPNPWVIMNDSDTSRYSYVAMSVYEAEVRTMFNANGYTLNGKYYNPNLIPYTQNFIDFVEEKTGFNDNLIDIVFGYGNGETRLTGRLYQEYAALLNGATPNRIANNLYFSPGLTANQGYYVKSRQEAIGAKASLSLNLKDHEIKFGFDIEKMTNRNYWVNAPELWTRMRDLTADSKYIKPDLTDPYWKHGDPIYGDSLPRIIDGWIQDTLMYRIISNLSNFDRNLRDRIGFTNNEKFVDVDSYDPSIFSINMFSNYELLRDGFNIIGYSGYDYTGKISRKKLNLNDFFSGESKEKNFDQKNYAIGAFEPIYLSLYLQDKFSISNLLFNVGLRLDYYNANQYVLKDPFLLRDAYTVKELKEQWSEIENILPSNVGENWIPYVATADNNIDNAPHGFVAYRNGKKWYNSFGQEVADPTSYLGQGGPVLKNELKAGDPKTSYDAFVKYKPQWTLMPRISFSFPVSTTSLFYAHYNIITNRPTNWQIEPIKYLFIDKFRSDRDILNNPNLRPQRTVTYEIGFRQKVGENAAINIGAYYSEIRDQIQSYRFTGAYPNTYYSFENQDFGTVQGFSAGFNVRGAKNVTFRASYTLSFAKGTGSSAESNLAIIASGQPNLRTLTNLEFDQRHKVSGSIDLRFDQGTNYNGPVTRVQKKNTNTTKEIRWLENAGVTLLFSANSGMPYSRSGIVYSTLGWGEQTSPQLQGSVNGAHKPWTFQCDLRVDKTFVFNLASKKDKSEGGKRKNKPGMLTVYLDFQNLFNLKNILNVYDYTGKATDDGYLSTPLFQTYASSLSFPIASENYYRMRIADPYNLAQPFRVHLGLNFNF